MIDLSTISPNVLLARGSYATIRAAHEDKKKELSILCGKLSAVASLVLRKMQPDNDAIPERVEDLLASGRWTIDEIEKTVTDIESLAKQRAELKREAW